MVAAAITTACGADERPQASPPGELQEPSRPRAFVVPDTTAVQAVSVARPEVEVGILLADSGMMRLPEVQAKMSEYVTLYQRRDLPRDEAMRRLHRWMAAYRAANPARLEQLRETPSGLPVR